MRYFIVFILLASTPLLSFTNHYIDNAASGGNNGSSWENAWQGFADIDWNSILPGDTVFISGGSSSKTYFEQLTITKSGTSGNPIVFTKGQDTGHEGSVLIDGEYVRYGVLSYGYSYITFEELSFDKTTQSFRMTNGEDIVINSVHSNIQIGRGVAWHNIDNGLISNCTITTDVGSFEYQTDCIYIQYGSNNTINNNYLVMSNEHPTPHSDGIQLFQETNPTICNNYIEVPCTTPVSNNGIWSETCSGTYTIYNNILYTPNFHNWANTFGYLERGADVNLIVYNNVFYGGTSPNVFAIDDADAIIKNNIFICDCTGRGVWLGNGLINSGNLDGNLYYFPNSPGILMVLGNQGSMTLSGLQTIGAESNGLSGENPQFVNLANRDFSLSVNSQAIDAGVDLLSPYNRDKNGIERPQGIGWDIGVYEMVGNGDMRPLPPGNLRLKNDE